MSEKEENLKKVSDAIIVGDEDVAKEAAEAAIKAGASAAEVVEKGLNAGLEVVGEKYEAKEFFYVDVLCSATAAKAAIDAIKPHIKTEKVPFAGTFVIGTVEGDIHDLGKDLVATTLEVAGFNVLNLGMDIPVSKFVETAVQNNADIIGSSAAMAGTSKDLMKKIEVALRKAGIRDKVKTMVGGVFLDEESAREIGADGFAENCFEALKKAEELMVKLKEERGK